MSVFIPRVICNGEECDEEMVIDKTGVITEMLTSNEEPYYKVSGDRYRCPSCGAVVTLLAQKHIAEAYQGAAYEQVMATQTARFQGSGVR